MLTNGNIILNPKKKVNTFSRKIFLPRNFYEIQTKNSLKENFAMRFFYIIKG